jgi:hypothetical protein
MPWSDLLDKEAHSRGLPTWSLQCGFSRALS